MHRLSVGMILASIKLINFVVMEGIGILEGNKETAKRLSTESLSPKRAGRAVQEVEMGIFWSKKTLYWVPEHRKLKDQIEDQNRCD